MTKHTLTIEQGRAIQAQQLEAWANVLKPEVLAEVKRRIALNEQGLPHALRDGFDVLRGNSIDSIVFNISHGNKEFAER